MLVQSCFFFFFRRFGSKIPRENACLVVFALGAAALSTSAPWAASLISAFGQLLRQASNGSVSTLLKLSKDFTINARFHPGSLIGFRESMAPSLNAAGAATYQALSCLLCEIVQVKPHTEDIKRSRCEQHLMCDQTWKSCILLGSMGFPHDGTNGTLPPKLVKCLKERVIGKRSLLGQTPVFRAHPINDCFFSGVWLPR